VACCRRSRSARCGSRARASQSDTASNRRLGRCRSVATPPP